MLIRLPPQQLQLGMFVERIEGSWLSHPFWKGRFRIDDPADLESLRASDVPAVWVNPDLGSGAEMHPATPAQAEPDIAEPALATPRPEAKPKRAARAAFRRAASPACSFHEEYSRAALVVDRARRAVQHIFEDAKLGRSPELAEVAPVVDEVAESISRNLSALITLTRLKTKDEFTYLHSVSVCALMVSLSRQLGLDRETTREAGMAGLLHDIGKMAMPAEVLNKPGELTAEEFAVMKGHPERGHEMLSRLDSVPASALDVCLHHHERVDGSGYPHGLSGGDISLFAKMGAVCDVYDAITSNRPYKEAWNAADSIGRMYKSSGHFDETVLAAFIRSIGIYPLGTLVRLSSDQLGIVVEQNHDRLTCPVVRVFHDIKGGRPLPLADLDLASPRHAIEIVGKEDPRSWGFADWDGRSTDIMKQPSSTRRRAA